MEFTSYDEPLAQDNAAEGGGKVGVYFPPNIEAQLAQAVQTIRDIQECRSLDTPRSAAVAIALEAKAIARYYELLGKAVIKAKPDDMLVYMDL